jgi:hypothetical protein
MRAERLAEGGSKDRGDVRIITSNEEIVLECKARQALNVTRELAKARAKNPGGITGVLWKRIKPAEGKKVRVPDGERYVVSLTLDDFLYLVERGST